MNNRAAEPASAGTQAPANHDPQREACREHIRALIEAERSGSCGAQARLAYEQFHAWRFRRLLEIVAEEVPDRRARVLDVGRSPFTALLAARYRDVRTLGFPLEQDDGGHREGGALEQLPHVVFDLNRAADVDAWPELPAAFDLILYSEAIEHIHTAPEFSLLMFGWMLAERGRLIVSTPNAAAWANRRRLLRGVNPFERLRYFDANPGHFREYTGGELRAMAPAAALQCLRLEWVDFYRRGRQRLIPALRDSLVAVYGKPPP